MTRTYSPMRTLFQGLTGLKLLPSCLTVIVLSGCSGLKPFPADHIIEYDRKNKVCGYYKIVDPEHFKVEYEKDIPCPDVFGFSSKDMPNILNWAQDAQDYVRNNCK